MRSPALVPALLLVTACGGPASSPSPSLPSLPSPPAQTSEAVAGDTSVPPPPSTPRSAFDSNQWSSSVGLGGGAGGRYGGRGGSATEAYANVAAHAFLKVDSAPLSTFAADVDTASFANVRRMLLANQLPPPEAVRAEEFVNAQDYDLPSPAADAPFAIVTELTSCPWQPAHHLLRIALRTRPIETAKVPPCNLVFLIDVSGSMAEPTKLPLVQRALATLADQLRPQDRVAIVTYAGNSRVALQPTSGGERERIHEALAGLRAGGSTHASGGIQEAYALAVQHKVAEGTNRVLLCTDGDFNVGVTSPDDLEALIRTQRDQGVFLTVLGVGTGNLKDDRLERLADTGNGVYAYLDSVAEARRLLVQQFGASLMTVAKDVKLQLEFDPRQVAAYRQIGYENRQLTAQEFRDDRKDAGDLGAGHAMTVLYEIVPVGGEPVATPLATLRIRHKPPLGDAARERSVPIAAVLRERPSRDQRLAVVAAALGQLLNGGRHLGTFAWPDLAAMVTPDLRAPGLADLVARAARLVAATR